MSGAFVYLFMVAGSVYTYELIACQPVWCESRIFNAADTLAQLGKNLVACLMPIGIINLLEAVYIEDEKGT